ncbi:MAG: ankyrin repeat domain-containing protein [Ignavibacteriaceae bacterium]|jgi:ankyrin repeat protein|nr:ankyrin repeat domain-containing protein [Ignavibacteriaceae bacterium]
MKKNPVEEALHIAAYNGHLQIVQYFIDEKVSVNSNYECALRWAALQGHKNIVKLLIENGANKSLALGYAKGKNLEEQYQALKKI